MAHAPEKYYDNLSACSLCMSCSDVCPVKVDLAEQIYKWRQDLDGLGKGEYGKEDHVRWNEVPDGASGIVQCCFVGGSDDKQPATIYEIQ